MSLTSRLHPQIEKLIDTIAEANASLIIARAHLPANRGDELVWLGKLCADARAIVAAWAKGDRGSTSVVNVVNRLLEELRVCEAGLEQLRKATS